jgi:hypothetical protein
VSSILTKDLKSNLEETRSRLLSEREALIQAAQSEAEAELDRTLQYINQLLGVSTSSEPSSPQVSQSSPSPAKGKGKGKGKAASAPAETKKTGSGKSSSKSFDASALKADFKSLKPMEAIVQILGDSKEPLSIDDLIAQLYEPFDQSEMSKARMSVAITTKHAERRGLLRKVQDNPSRFQAV